MIDNERLRATQRSARLLGRLPGRIPGITSGLVALTLVAWWVAPLDPSTAGTQTSALFWQGALDANKSLLALQSITAHLLHTDHAHLLWNLLGLSILGCVIERYSRPLLIASVVSGMFAVATWFHLFSNGSYYVGWSGVLNSLLVCCLWALYLPTPELPTPELPTPDLPKPARQALVPEQIHSPNARRLNNALIAGIALAAFAKLVWELTHNEALLTHTAWPSAPGAHLAGMIAGMLLCVLAACRHRV